MKKKDTIESNTYDSSHYTDRINRRDFLKISAAVSSSLMLGSAGLATIPGCGYNSDWKGISFPKVVLHNFKLFDSVSNKLQKDLALIIESDEIRGIERKGDLSQYKDYKVVDLKGFTVLPGLIDNHVHVTVPFMYSVNYNTLSQMNPQIRYNFRNCIMSGITTVRDVGGFPGKLNKFREMADKNEIPGPRVISSLSPIAAREGDLLGAPEKAPYFKNPILKWILGGNYAERPIGVEEIKAACEEMVQLGAQWLKTLQQDHPYSYAPRKLPNHSDDGYKAILKTGEKYGIKCALHEPLLSGFKKGVDLGFHTLEHMPMDGVIPDRYIEKFIKNEMAIMPTIMIYGDSFVINKILDLINDKGGEYLMPEAIKQMSGRLRKTLEMEKSKLSEAAYADLQFDNQYAKDMFPNVTANLKKLHRMGATIGAGSDIGGTASGFFGRFSDELKHYISAGISNFDVLRMATSVNAHILDMEDKIGTIEKGKLADIIAVDGNPLNDISAVDKTMMVMKGGFFVKNIGIDLG
ncbi:MAG: amidohydrolase family protein [Deltaproteobacteria bacterium]|nr:amidohydrolase family protein [Deltaproteobacteria bacterium]